MYRLIDLPQHLQQTAFEDIDDTIYNAHARKLLGIPSHYVAIFKTLVGESSTSFDTKWLRNENNNNGMITYLPSDKLRYFLDGIRRWKENCRDSSIIERFDKVEQELLPLLLSKEKEVRRKNVINSTPTSVASSLEKDGQLKAAKLQQDKERLLLELKTRQKAWWIRLSIGISIGVLIALLFQLCDK